MLGRFARRLLTAVAVLSVVSAGSAASEVLSTMRNVNAVAEAHGFRVEPAYDVTVAPLPTDLSSGQAFEIIRPDDRPVTIGRLFTSCTCIQLQAHKRTFAPGERAILQLRNIRPTPPAGQNYAIFVQITSPVRTTLRFDTFVQTLQPGATATPPAEAAPATAASPTTGANSDLAAAITRQLEAAEAEIENEIAKANAEAAASVATPSEPAATAEPGVVQLKDGSTVTEVTGELRDELEAMLEREFAGYRADIEAGRILPEDDAVLTDAERKLRDLGTADLAYDIGNDLPAFDPAIPTGGDTPAPAAEAPAPETAAAPQPATPSPEPLSQPEPIVARTANPALVTAPGPVEPAPASAPVAAEPAQPAAVSQPPERDPNSKKPVQAISLITIGVRDMAASIRFYEALGWRRAARGKYDQTAFFQLQGQILALYPVADLLREQNMENASPAPGGITLALHVHDKADVWSVYQRFIDAGGAGLRPPAEMPSGAVSSYVADPDGNAWEISWVPQFRIDEDGGLWLP